MIKTCKYCDYRGPKAIGDGMGDHFECRRYAPRPDRSIKAVIWPHVGADDWCGEHKPREG